MSNGPPKASGGILRTQQHHPRKTGDNEEGGAIGRGVTFSTSDTTGIFARGSAPSSINIHDHNGGEIAAASTASFAARARDVDDGDEEYDSDVVDTVLASGDALIHGAAGRNRNLDDNENGVINDAVVRTPAEIAEAKRKRGRVRRHEDEYESLGEEVAEDLMCKRRYLDDGGPDDRDVPEYAGGNLSLITDRAANPDAYESNAYGNASCPVEPFNMDAERDGGLGYFDGDTYVFRRNRKPIDGEEDAWLDGASDDDDDNYEEGRGGQTALDSITSVRKPRAAPTDDNNQGRKKSKYVNDDDNHAPEDLGRRLATLLSRDDETVMMALARYGAIMRELRARLQMASKKSKLGKRRKSPSADEVPTSSDADADDAAAAVTTRQLRIEMERTREMVEELTELADALLFEGETEAYELTRRDWNHRFKWVGQSSPLDDDSGIDADFPVAKKNRGRYFDGTANAHQTEEVMWEYKGNEDGVVHGPFTSRQMLEWTTSGYFVGESSVDIRRVMCGGGVLGNNGAGSTGKTEVVKANADVDDLMADLLDDDDDVERTKVGADDTSATTSAESWLRSDRVDFSVYL